MSSTPFLFRLARFARLLAHFARGLATLALRFHRYPEAERTAAIQQWSQQLLAIVHVESRFTGMPPSGGLIVMNHISWLDIFVLNAVAPSRFVAKSEIATWPLVGYLCTKSGTLYIERAKKTAARTTNRRIAESLAQGDRVALFPEGSTTYGDQLLRFHAALLQPAIAAGGSVHPVTLQYVDPEGRRTIAGSYVGEESLVDSVWRLLGARRVIARLQFGTPERAAGRHRRELADTLHAVINRSLASDEANPAPGIAAGLQAAPR